MKTNQKLQSRDWRVSAGPSLAGDEAYRAAMRRFATTVSVVSTSWVKLPYGMTATAITSLCTNPAALLVCVNKSSSIHRPLEWAGRFCVNVLQTDQQEVSLAFSGS